MQMQINKLFFKRTFNNHVVHLYEFKDFSITTISKRTILSLSHFCPQRLGGSKFFPVLSMAARNASKASKWS